MLFIVEGFWWNKIEHNDVSSSKSHCQCGSVTGTFPEEDSTLQYVKIFFTVTHENVDPYYSPQPSIMDRSSTPRGSHYIRTQLYHRMSTEEGERELPGNIRKWQDSTDRLENIREKKVFPRQQVSSPYQCLQYHKEVWTSRHNKSVKTFLDERDGEKLFYFSALFIFEYRRKLVDPALEMTGCRRQHSALLFHILVKLPVVLLHWRMMLS